MFCKRRITVIIAVTALCAAMQPRQILQAFREETVLLPVKQGVLEGTWTWPDGNGPWPAALLIQGSGPLDRDGNGPGGAGAGEMALLARGLAERGTAVLRFDKAGTGRSPVIRREEDLRWEDGTEYAVLWTERMRQRKEVSAFFLIGHSEGALTALEAARRTDPDGVILLASPGFPAGTVLRLQLISRVPWLYGEADRVLSELEQGRPAENTDERLNLLFRPSVQPFLKGLLQDDPRRSIRALSCLVLMIQGDRDSQVGTKNGKALQQAARDGEFRIISGMNHVLKTVPSDRDSQEESYGNPLIPLSPGLADMTARWIQRRSSQRDIQKKTDRENRGQPP